MRMWEIRESDRDPHKEDYKYGRRSSMGMRDYTSMKEMSKDYEEGYECGFEEGYAKAMKDTFYSHNEKDFYGERRMSR